MVNVRLVEHRPLRGDEAIGANIIAERGPKLVAGPARGDVVQDDVVVVAVGDLDVHGASLGARGDVDVVGTESAVAHDYVVCGDEQRIHDGFRTADDPLSWRTPAGDGDLGVFNFEHPFGGDDPRHSEDAGAWAVV